MVEPGPTSRSPPSPTHSLLNRELQLLFPLLRATSTSITRHLLSSLQEGFSFPSTLRSSTLPGSFRTCLPCSSCFLLSTDSSISFSIAVRFLKKPHSSHCSIPICCSRPSNCRPERQFHFTAGLFLYFYHVLIPSRFQPDKHTLICVSRGDISRYTLLSTNYLKQLTIYVSRSFVSLLIVKLFKLPRSKNYILLLPVVSAGHVGNQIRIKSELEFKPLLQNKIKCTCSPNTKAPITSENRRVMLFRKQKIFCKLAKVTRESESVSCSAISDSETLWTVAYQAPLSMRFSRQEYWSGLPFPPPPGDLSNPGIEPGSPVLQADCLLPEP